jgi:hypothetical protein
MSFKSKERETEYAREWREKNRDKVKQMRHELYLRTKERQNAQSKKWRAEHPREWRKYYRQWLANLSPEKKAEYAEKQKRYRHAHPEIYRNAARKYQENKPRQYWSNQLINAAVHLGILTRPDHCSQCGSRKRIQAHHPDYSKPLEVVWLCATCHGKVHRSSMHSTEPQPGGK